MQLAAIMDMYWLEQILETAQGSSHVPSEWNPVCRIETTFESDSSVRCLRPVVCFAGRGPTVLCVASVC